MSEQASPGNVLRVLLENVGGVYVCRKDANGKRIGPLVGYAGKYDAGGAMKSWVGEVYYNFAMVERWPVILGEFARNLAESISGRLGENMVDCCLGMPMGGVALAFELARRTGARFAFAEKKVTAAATETAREQSDLVLDRHLIEPGQGVALVEDVCNNFSTVGKAVGRVEEKGASVIAVVCAINRAMDPTETGTVVHDYSDGTGFCIPVISALDVPTAQFHQDDPFVAADVAADNIVWKPKDRWDHLQALMHA